MKAVILAGGLGTRIAEETTIKPKPMIEIGGKPILWHIMKMYSQHGIDEFVVCCGYKGYVIKEYFANYFLHMSDVTFDLKNNKIEVHNERAESWKVTLVDTGEATMTGGRLKRIFEYIKDEDAFCLAYGDGVSDIDISESIRFHLNHGKLATLTAINPTGRFGVLQLDNGRVNSFEEKPKGEGSLINGGFFVLSPKVLELVNDDDCVWEHEPLKTLVKRRELMAYEHKGFWHPMDTLRDNQYLQSLWQSGSAPWKTWE